MIGRKFVTSILDRFRLDGQVAVVTDSGKGIGAATALALADAGADVVISARSQAEIDVVAEDVRKRGVRALAVPRDVRVNAIAVGSVLTDALKGCMTPELEKGMMARTSMGRLRAPDDIAGCALYLASAASSSATGAALPVNGGITQSQVSMPKPRL